MEAEARYTLVGAGTLLLVTAVVITVMWMQNFSQRDEFTFYTIYFQNQRIDGLQIDSSVDMRGVDVGRVVSFELADFRENEALVNRVRVVISLNNRVPVYSSTAAVITRNLVTGIAQISLVTPNSEDTRPLQMLANEPYLVIAEGRSDLDEIAGKVERLGDMASEIMVNLNRLLSDENRDNFTALISNLSTLTESINERMTKLDEVLDGFDAATGSISQAGDEFSGLAKDVGDQVELLVEDVRTTVMQGDQTMQNVSEAMQSLKQQGATISAQLDRTGAVLSDQVAAAVAELKLTLESAEVTLQRLQDPRSAVLGVSPARLGPGERK